MALGVDAIGAHRRADRSDEHVCEVIGVTRLGRSDPWHSEASMRGRCVVTSAMHENLADRADVVSDRHDDRTRYVASEPEAQRRVAGRAEGPLWIEAVDRRVPLVTLVVAIRKRNTNLVGSPAPLGEDLVPLDSLHRRSLICTMRLPPPRPDDRVRPRVSRPRTTAGPLIGRARFDTLRRATGRDQHRWLHRARP